MYSNCRSCINHPCIYEFGTTCDSKFQHLTRDQKNEFNACLNLKEVISKAFNDGLGTQNCFTHIHHIP